MSATVYAPRSAVELTGSADYYGTFVGKTMLVGGAASVHDDESAREAARNIRLVE